jgi:pimeloyl-ACP methyl ester carboxylesterase
MQEVELSGGRIRCRDRGEGRPVVFVHGVFVNSTVWRKLESPLASHGFRFVAPDLPLGAHDIPMHPDADLSPRGVAGVIAEFLEVLDLRDVTIVATDTGGAIVQLLLAAGCERVARVVLTPCDSFDNFLPPSIRALQHLARIPGTLAVGAQPFRSKRLRRLGFRTLAKYPNSRRRHRIVGAAAASRLRGSPQLARFLSAVDHRDTDHGARQLSTLAKPVLLVWARHAPIFPYEHAERWARILPNTRLIDAGDSYTFVAEDQPDLLAHHLVAFADIH